jgi:hypothetical protein
LEELPEDLLSDFQGAVLGQDSPVISGWALAQACGGAGEFLKSGRRKERPVVRIVQYSGVGTFEPGEVLRVIRHEQQTSLQMDTEQSVRPDRNRWAMFTMAR